MSDCIICGLEVADEGRGRDSHQYSCRRCGNYVISGTAKAMLRGEFSGADDPKRAILSYAVRQMQQSADWPVLSSDSYRAILSQTELPKPATQAENLLLWLGNAVDGSDGYRQAEPEYLQAVIGGRRPVSVAYIASYLRDQRMINYAEVNAHNAPRQLNIQMLPAGWERFEELKREVTTSRTAFMAMQYNNAELDSLVEAVLRPAVQATGFELRVLTDVPRAGLIDDRLRVEIRRSRFLIADITHGNLGAY